MYRYGNTSKVSRRLLVATRRLAMAFAVAGASFAATAEEASPVFSLDEVSRGQTGYGLSVFAGSEPERFEVEVLGVMRNSTAELSYILARLEGQDLERSGVIQGMSGSPVYLDDRLAGAVAFSYTFGMDAIAGITPIEAMRRLGQIPPQQSGEPRSMSAPSSLHVPLFEDMVRREFRAESLLRDLERLRPVHGLGGRSALQWSAAGFGDEAMDLLGQAVGPLAPTGSWRIAATGASLASGEGEGEHATQLVPGSSVAGVLVAGDLNLAVHGTVTDRYDEQILAFGHPVFSSGPLRLPMAGSEVLTIIANRASSFKVANTGSVVGAFDQDREAGVHGRLGLDAPMIPLSVKLRGLDERDYQMSVADLPELTPTLLTIAALGAVNAGTYAIGRQGVDFRARFHLVGYDDLEIRQSFDGDQAVIDSVLYLMTFARFLQLNAMEQVEIESVEVEFSQSPDPRIATLLSAHADRTQIEPGETVAITLELQAYRGERYRRVIEVEVDEKTQDGPFYLLIGDGTSMDAARLTIEPRAPANLEQTLRFFQGFHTRRELQIFGLAAGSGLVVEGEVLPRLPGSVSAIFAASGTSAGTPLTLVITQQQMEVLDRPIEGILRLDFEVRRRL